MFVSQTLDGGNTFMMRELIAIMTYLNYVFKGVDEKPTLGHDHALAWS